MKMNLIGIEGGETLQEAVFQALGAASVCWEDVGKAGVFDSDRCKAIGDELMEIVSKQLGMLGAQIHKTATEHGWWEEPRTFGDIIALIHSEVSEALEEFRNGHTSEIYYSGEQTLKPEGVPTELADVIIRVLDAAHQYEIDIDEAIRVKMAYNETRPFRHGGKAL